MSECGLLFVAWGVVTLVAGPSKTLQASVRGPLPHHHKACPPLTCPHRWWKSAPGPLLKEGPACMVCNGIRGCGLGGVTLSVVPIYT